MEEINIHNYESFLLDYCEGVLTDEQVCDLELFVMLNPNLAIDLNNLELINLSNEELCFYEKKQLKKTESDLISENQFIGYIENQLSALDTIHLEKSCELNISLAKELELYKSTCLIADETIIYPTPNDLKRRPKVIWYNFSVTSFAAAASIVILLGLFFVWRNYNADFKLKEVVAFTEMKKIKNSKDYKRMNNNKNGVLVNQKNNMRKENKTNLATNALNKMVTNKVINKTATNDLGTATNNVEILNNSQPEDFITNNIIKDALISNPEKIKTRSVVTVISENEPNEIINNQSKKGAWAIACKALNKLNKLGVKIVNGSESESNGYALNFGELSLKHKIATEN